MQEEIQKSMKFMKQKYFAGADKAGKMLTSLIKKRRLKSCITKLIVDKKNIIDHEGIKEAFAKYFQTFYKSKHVNPKRIQEYLDKLETKPISEEIKAELNKEVTIEEITKVIKEMKLNKSPGPDGFTAIYYKKLKERLTPILKDLISGIIKEVKTPESWSEAYITLILKEQQDPTLMKSYRPISLLNEDYKIYAKIWANRLKTFLVNFICEDQLGFLPKKKELKSFL